VNEYNLIADSYAQVFFKQKEELHKSSNFWLKTSCKKKKRFATMQHSARTSFHITYSILSHKQTVFPTI